MKTIYTLLILLLSVSFANAQSNMISTEAQTVNEVSISEVNDDVTVISRDATSSAVIEKENVMIDASKVKESIARSSSDIRIYLNRLKNVENIKLLFPQINKAKSA
jgi:hypothetical protein